MRKATLFQGGFFVFGGVLESILLACRSVCCADTGEIFGYLLRCDSKKILALPLAQKNSPLHLPHQPGTPLLAAGSFQVLYRSGERLGSLTRWQPSTARKVPIPTHPRLGRAGTYESSAMENLPTSAFFHPDCSGCFARRGFGFLRFGRWRPGRGLAPRRECECAVAARVVAKLIPA